MTQVALDRLVLNRLRREGHVEVQARGRLPAEDRFRSGSDDGGPTLDLPSEVGDGRPQPQKLVRLEDSVDVGGLDL